jgi:hypothetical protein
MADGRTPSSNRGSRKTPRKSPKRKLNDRTAAEKKVEGGGSTPAVDAVKRGRTYEAIFNGWREGIDYTTLAQRHEMTPRRVRQIVDEMRSGSAEAVEITNPIAALHYVDGLLVQLDRAVTQAALILEGAISEKNWAGAIGAHRRLGESRRELLELKQLRGIIPKNLAALEEQWSLVQFMGRVLAAFERHNIPNEVRIEIAETGRLATRTDRGTVELDMRAGGGV